MSDAGYTLAETLVALAMIGLAIGGMSSGVHVLAQQHARTHGLVADTQALRAAEVRVQRLMELRGPFRSHEPASFAGGPEGFEFDCGEAQPCRVALSESPKGLVLELGEGGEEVRRVRLRFEGAAEFVYRGAETQGPAWPPNSADRQALRSVALMRGEGAAAIPVLEARAWTEQPADCAFDVVLQDCR